MAPRRKSISSLQKEIANINKRVEENDKRRKLLDELASLKQKEITINRASQSRFKGLSPSARKRLTKIRKGMDRLARNLG